MISSAPIWAVQQFYTNTRAGYTADCPNAGKLVTNMKFSLAMENEIMGAILDDGEDPEAAAMAWLESQS